MPKRKSVVAPNSAGRGLGWKPDIPDARDFRYSIAAPIPLPMVIDLRPQFARIPIFDQKTSSSCVAQSASAAVSYLWMKQGIPHQIASRLFIYYNTRVMENTVNEDSGVMIRDAIKSLAAFGVPDEQLWPFILTKIFTKPSEQAYAEALKHQVLKYERVSQTETDMETRLAEGFPIIGGFTVYDSFMSQEVAKTGIAKMPDLRRERANGGHAILLCGYKQKSRQFIVRNSWGTEWGSLGHFFMPYDYFLNSDLADDFWTVEFVEQ
jgi:C1A family cysteine protease